MPAIFVFLFKVNIALLLFCAGYYFILRRLTFYTINRVYLFTAIVFASVYPKINISDFAERHKAITQPVQIMVLNFQATTSKVLDKPNYWQWAEVAFWIGAALFACRLLIQLYSLFKIYRGSKPMEIYGHDIRAIADNANPFSFWKSIYVNPDKHEPADLKSILMHEQIHVDELHTVDILLAEISTIFYWFNPGIWLIKKAIRENIEFITDREILNKGFDTKQYQYSLVNVSFAAEPNGIVNHFNISTIKKRIIMMNAKRSSKINITRYALLMPAVIVMLLAFNISKAAYLKPLLKKAFTIRIVTAPVAKPDQAPAPVLTADTNSREKKTLTITPVTKPFKITLDTIKRVKVSFYNYGNSADSANYFVNGVKSDIKNVEPSQLESVYILNIEDGKKFLSDNDVRNLNPNLKVVFFFTKGDTQSAELAEKIKNYEAANKGQINAHINVNGTTSAITSSNWNNSSVTTKVSPGDVKVINITGANISKDAKVAYVVGIPHKSDNINIVTNTSSTTNINDFANRLIIIDGKEASEKELKKISVDKIKSISLHYNDDTTKPYGDKAKNGLVDISTKDK